MYPKITLFNFENKVTGSAFSVSGILLETGEERKSAI